MSEELVPLFIFKDKKDDKYKPANVIVSDQGDKYKTSSFITSVVDAIKKDVESILTGEKVGDLTISGYILLETLQQMGASKILKDLLSEKTDLHNLHNAAIFCAIGMKAGIEIPEGVKFDAVPSESGLSVWNIPTDEMEENN
jgi:hypothetical protein